MTSAGTGFAEASLLAEHSGDLPDLTTRVRDALDAQRALSDRTGTAPDTVDLITEIVEREAPLLSDVERDSVIHRVTASVVGLGVIDRLLADPEVSDVLINGPGPVWIERLGMLERTDMTVDTSEIHHYIERLVAPLGLRADRSNPIVDARLPDGTRFNVVLPPLAPYGPLIAVRRHRSCAFDLGSYGPDVVVETIQRIVAERLNVIIYGATGSGKTSLVGSIASLFCVDERVIVVEDRAELVIPGDHILRLESRPAGLSGNGGVSIRDLVRTSLRLRPDRLIVGEVRGPEALDMIWAMSSGHSGSLSTCHASDASDALMRLETMMLLSEANLSVDAVRAQIYSAVDVLVGMRRGCGGQRVVSQVHLVASDGSLRKLRLPDPMSLMEAC